MIRKDKWELRKKVGRKEKRKKYELVTLRRKINSDCWSKTEKVNARTTVLLCGANPRKEEKLEEKGRERGKRAINRKYTQRY